MRRAFHRIRIIVPWGVMTNCDNIRLELERKITNRLIIIRIRHHRRQIALRETKAGMPIPRNFHEKASGVNYDEKPPAR